MKEQPRLKSKADFQKISSNDSTETKSKIILTKRPDERDATVQALSRSSKETYEHSRIPSRGPG